MKSGFMTKLHLVSASFIFFCFLNNVSYPQTPNWLWAKSAGGTNADYGYSVTVDVSGNAYVTGNFVSPSITFGSFTLTNNESYGSDVFLAKYDGNGNVLWAKSAGGTYVNQGYSVSVDASGNAYVTGYFTSPTITFGPYTLTNAGGGNFFLAKYDGNGNVLWAKSAGGIYADVGNSVAVDASGNAYVTGFFQSSTIIFGSDTLKNAGYDNIFLTKFDPNGNVLWAKSAGGGPDEAQGISVAVDASGNAYLTGGCISSTIIFGSDTLKNVGGLSIFLVKYDASGNVFWAKNSTGADNAVVNAIAVDAVGNSYMTGTFNSPIIIFDYDTLKNIGDKNIFFVAYDPTGNVIWAKSAGGTYEDEGYSVAVDSAGDAYFTGAFTSSTINFGSTTLTNVGDFDIFLAKLGQCKLLSGSISGPSTVCQGDTGKIYSVTPVASATGYHWSVPPGVIITSGNNTNIITVTFTSTSVSGSFSVYAYNTNCNGPSSTSFNITVNTVPIPTINGTSQVCFDSLFYNYTTQPGMSNYTWNISDGGSIVSGAGTNQIKVKWNTRGSQFININYITPEGCITPIPTNFPVLIGTVTDISLDTTICFGQSYFAGGAFRSKTGTYTDTLSVSAGCDSIKVTHLTVKPKIPVDLGGNRSICPGEKITLNATLTGSNYIWQDSSTDSVYVVSEPGTYWVHITNDSCTAGDTILITDCSGELWFPSAFTPNGDGLNDVFRPKGFNIATFHMIIYNRSGQLLFETEDMEAGWDGKVKGTLCPADTYTFIATYGETDNTGKTKKKVGTFILLR